MRGVAPPPSMSPNMEAPSVIKYISALSLLKGDSVSGNYGPKRFYDGSSMIRSMPSASYNKNSFIDYNFNLGSSFTYNIRDSFKYNSLKKRDDAKDRSPIERLVGNYGAASYN